MRLHQQMHYQFQLKGTRKWNGIKEGCWTPWFLQDWIIELFSTNVCYFPRAATPTIEPAGKAASFLSKMAPRGQYHPSELGADVATPVGLEDRVSNQRGLFLGLKMGGICLTGFWTCLGPITPFFLLTPPFCIGNVCPITVPSLNFEAHNFFYIRFISGKKFYLRVNHILSLIYI